MIECVDESLLGEHGIGQLTMSLVVGGIGEQDQPKLLGGFLRSALTGQGATDEFTGRRKVRWRRQFRRKKPGRRRSSEFDHLPKVFESVVIMPVVEQLHPKSVMHA